MRIAIYQGPELPQSIELNLRSLELYANEAAAQGANALIAPEMFLTGYNIGAQNIADLAETADGESSRAIAEIAINAGIAVLYGYPESASGNVYNSAQVIDINGQRLANYRKSHLFGDLDRNAFSAGNEATVTFHLDGWQIGILICYDIEFPENVRNLALAGADFVAVPTALMEPYHFVPNAMVPTRAYENQIFIAYGNRCGEEKELRYCGLSCIVGPDGEDVARASASEELIFATLDRSLLESSRKLNTYLEDRRPELYRDLRK